MTTSVSQGIGTLLQTMLICSPFYGIARVLWLRKQSRDTEVQKDLLRLQREIVLAAFALFMLGLLVLTFQNEGLSRMKEGAFSRAWFRLRTGIGTNFVPFRTIKSYVRHSLGWRFIMINIVGNVVMFLPWGLGLPLLWKAYQGMLKMTMMSFVLPFCIEFIQLFIGRSVDVDDIILNFIGGMSGWLLYLILAKIFPKIRRLAK